VDETGGEGRAGHIVEDLSRARRVVAGAVDGSLEEDRHLASGVGGVRAEEGRAGLTADGDAIGVERVDEAGGEGRAGHVVEDLNRASRVVARAVKSPLEEDSHLGASDRIVWTEIPSTATGRDSGEGDRLDEWKSKVGAGDISEVRT